VSESAAVLAEQIRNAAAWAKSELDLQMEVAGTLKEFARRAKVTLEGRRDGGCDRSENDCQFRRNPFFQVIRSLLASGTVGASVLRRSRVLPRTPRCPLRQKRCCLVLA
jgi:hypothetical protein